MATYTQDKLYDLWFDNKITERDLDLRWERMGCPNEHALRQEGL